MVLLVRNSLNWFHDEKNLQVVHYLHFPCHCQAREGEVVTVTYAALLPETDLHPLILNIDDPLDYSL